jgi:hypothetical protein
MVSLGAALVSWHFARQASRLRHEALDLAKLNWATQYLSDIRAWAAEVNDCIARSAHLFPLEGDQGKTNLSQEVLNREMAILSSCIDRGRWFFPNLKESDFGTWKHDAYKGFRHKTLDPLVEIYLLMESFQNGNQGRSKAPRKFITERGRVFVSHIHLLMREFHKQANVEQVLQELNKERKNSA